MVLKLASKSKKALGLDDIPIIFLTSKTDSTDIVADFEIGAMDYVGKPYNTNELLARINTHLTRRKSLAGYQGFVLAAMHDGRRFEKCTRLRQGLFRNGFH